MSTLKNIFFLALCLIVGLGIGKGFVWWRQSDHKRGFEKQEDPPLITGQGDAPGNRGFTVQASDLGSLLAILKDSQAVFATTVGLEYSSAVNKAALAGAVQEAHRRHMHFVLLPPPAFNAQNPYPRPLREIAVEAQEAGVDMLCISWLNTEPDDAYWKQQAAEVRGVFQGRTILAATPDIMQWVGCWSVVDVLGAIGPVPLAHREAGPDTPLEMQDYRVSWNSALTSLESLARVNTKPLALLHMNVPAEAGHPQAQKLAYEALLYETKGRAQTTDVLLFNWGGAEAPQRLDQGKLADAWDPKKPKLPDPPAAASTDGDDGGDGGGG